ncbi:MAG TPA: hypothetical protein DHW82_13595, partial [Spirochaetia bacterium]|nr:hypothetical protein [Spirochaetia bacterium]
MIVISFYHYLLFHTLIELFSIFIGIGIFVFAINSLKKNEESGNFYLFIGIFYGGVSLIDLFHTLVFKGMSIFTGLTVNHSAQFWIISRMIEALALFSSVLFFYKIKKIKSWIVLTINFFFIFFAIFSVLVFSFFPDCYIEGQGLTAFKVYSEYVIILILLSSFFILRKKRKEIFKSFNNYVEYSLAIFFTIAAELSFTLYVDSYGIFNMLGHIFKLLSFLMIYQSVLKNLLKRPFEKLTLELEKSNLRLQEDLTEIQKQYQEIVQNINDMITIVNEDGIVLFVNNQSYHFWGKTPEEYIGKIAFDFVYSEDREKTMNAFQNWKKDSFESIQFENRSILNIWTLWNIKLLRKNGQLRFFPIAKDISEIKQYQEELQKEKTIALEANQAKTQFLSNMSHEIRTPLTQLQR